jgi:hypothetical protein
LVHVGLSDETAAESEAVELLGLAPPEDRNVSLFLAEKVLGQREWIAGVVQDPQFGPYVLLGSAVFFRRLSETPSSLWPH